MSTIGESNLLELFGFGVGIETGGVGVAVVVVARVARHFVVSAGSVISPCSSHVLIAACYELEYFHNRYLEARVSKPVCLLVRQSPHAPL